MSMTIMVRRL